MSGPIPCPRWVSARKNSSRKQSRPPYSILWGVADGDVADGLVVLADEPDEADGGIAQEGPEGGGALLVGAVDFLGRCVVGGRRGGEDLGRSASVARRGEGKYSWEGLAHTRFRKAIGYVTHPPRPDKHALFQNRE